VTSNVYPDPSTKRYITLEKLGDLVDQLVDFYVWNQVNAQRDLDREKLHKAATALLQLHDLHVNTHVVDYLMVSAIATGRYEQMQDPEQMELADSVLGELGFSVHEIQRHWH